MILISTQNITAQTFTEINSVVLREGKYLTNFVLKKLKNREENYIFKFKKEKKQ